jgi:nitrogen fixation/metabolism regulation signal transduction histidine kinase
MSALAWWARQILFTLAALFFLIFGIQLLISAYSLNDPFSFIMTFFASNLIILISLAMLVAFFFQIRKVVKSNNELPVNSDK